MQDILREPLNSPAAWRGSNFAGNSAWIYTLTAEQILEIETAMWSVATQGLDPLRVRTEDFPLPTVAPFLADIRGEIEGGRGFALLRGLPVDRWSEQQATVVFWGLGTHLGVAEPQDVDGTLLHHVRDCGKDLRTDATARAYETNLEIPYHNDGSDIFMLLCRRAAKQGGRSRLISAVALFNEVVRRRPDLAEVLQQDFHFDARGQQLPGTGRCQVHPIYIHYARRLHVLYKRGYIMLAQRFENVPRLTDRQLAAMDLLDAIAEEPGIRLEFDMQPGDLQMANNYDILHGRTAFEDYDDTARKRHCLRLWLTLPFGRLLPPEFEHTREFHWSYTRRMMRGV